MPVARSYPGVYIQEIPSGVRTITGVATSITAFIGRALSGPLNQPVTINSFGDFERIFGGLWVSSTLGFAVRDFFLNGGSRAIIVRLFHPYYPTRNDRTKVITAASSLAAVIGALSAPPPAILSAVQAAVDAANVSAAAQGPAVALAVQRIGQAAVNAATPAAVLPSVVVAAVNTARDTLTPNTRTRWSLKTLQPDDTTAGADVVLEAKYDGTYTSQYKVVITPVTGDVRPSIIARYGGGANDWANITINDGIGASPGILETFQNVTLVDSERRLDRVLENESNLLRVDPLTTWPGTPNHLNSKTSANPNYSPISGEVISDGTDLVTTDLTGLGAKGGLNALEYADLFNLLCVPPLTSGVALDASLCDALIDMCQRRRAIFLIDGPWADVATAISAGSIGSASKNAAVYFPRLRQPNPLRSNLVEDFAPCGAVAGVIARTDAARGVWKAPAGLDAALNGVPQLSLNLNDQESGQLNQKGINALRSMPAAGRVIWGTRSRVGADGLASEWKYLPVRRTALYIEESLYRGTQWAVFQPNSETLWSQLRLSATNFMQDLFRQGAFAGQTPQDAYFVRCDSSTTTQSDINQGVVNIIVGFAPLKPAEFVIISLQQMAGQSVT